MPDVIKAKRRMPAATRLQELNDAANQLRSLELQITGNIQLAQLLWDDVLDADEQARLDGSFLSSFNTINGAIEIWQKLHPVSRERAVVDLAYELNLVTRARHQKLLRHVERTGGDHGVRRRPDIPASAAEAEIRSYAKQYRLVLVRRDVSLDVHWSGTEAISGLRFGQCFGQFLWYLAALRTKGLPLSSERLADLGVSLSLRDVKYRLTKQLSTKLPDLAVAITAHDSRGYFLNIEAKDICLLVLDEQGALRKQRNL